jgi:fibro-slime domain-containing protein
MRVSNLALYLVLTLCGACAASGTGATSGDPDAGDTTRIDSGATASPGAMAPIGAAPIDEETRNKPPRTGCGNGKLTEDEACDDGNREDGDGCLGNCLRVEPGYSCNPPGGPCRMIARCGDGVVAPTERCDDLNTAEGDGCSPKCKLEVGFKCEGAPSKCTPATCGDKKVEGAEACDDGNDLPFDGCSNNCQVEPDCAKGACTSKCGDGLVLNEKCDDGNNQDGDGCSAKCEPEAGFMCTTDDSCQMKNGKCVLRVPVIYRDFNADHPDFEVGCGQLVTGVVRNELNAEGKPVLANGSAACIESASSFGEWYTSSTKNATIPGELVLYENGMGGFVNRYGPDGEQWPGQAKYTNILFGGEGGMGCGMCTPSPNGRCFDPCLPWGMGSTQACCADVMQDRFDGSPLFFPIDGAPNARTDTRLRAKIPEQYGYNGWPYESTVFPDAKMHNFHFTTEVVYWFRYDNSTAATLDFSGDDDVWVFVNGKLAVDLGGPHVPTNRRFTVDASSGPMFDLKPGNVYPIRVFHAERKAEGSSFRLTLDGFNTARSDCSPICGDAIVSMGEECDDGKNDGGYGECDAGCKLGPHCGDGVMQENEDCDDGPRNAETGCGACRQLQLF